jgi:wyosine [tRNA(Phe)-imidazoG37] synthetase (radical SAM superfamily)
LVNERREYIPREQILAEVKAALAAHQPGEIDWVTFVGSGEPTLHSQLGWVIREVKAITTLPIAVITNGSLLYTPEVRWALSAADAVLPSLDAASTRLYRRINRPRLELTLVSLVEGLVAFRKEFSGRLWVEVMLVQGLNDTEDALRDIAATMEIICPDQVHINLPTRPPVEPWVQPPDETGLARATAILGEKAQVVHPAEGTFDLTGFDHAIDALVAILARHPMREEDLVHTLQRWTPGQVEEALEALASSGQVQVVERYGCQFWCVAGARFAVK